LTAETNHGAMGARVPDQSAKADPVTVEVIKRRLVAIADHMDLNITRTAFSLLVSEYKDYAVGIVDGEGRLLCQSTAGMPLFIADVLGAAVRDGLKIYGADGFEEGDVVVSNDIGQHLNNVAMYTPVFDSSQNRPVAFIVVVMHWVDIGGRNLGSTSRFATDIWQEGLLLNTVKLYAAGKLNAEVQRIIRTNSRLPDELMGDIDAQIGACYMGRDGVAGILSKYGLPVFRQCVEAMWAQAERASRKAIAAIPDGTYTAEAFMDDDGLHRGKPIPLKVTVIIEGEQMTVDLSDLPKETQSSINAGASGGGHSVARLGFRYALLPEGHASEGTFRPLRLVLPEGNIMNCGPAAARSYYNLALPTLIDLVIRALAPVNPHRAAGGHYATFSSVRFRGTRPGSKAPFQCAESGFGGWGALSDGDGPGPFRTMCHGDTRLIPIEAQEAEFPLLLEEMRLRTDSGGAGKFRGGLGMTKKYKVLGPCEFAILADRTACPPWGINGGGPARGGAAFITKADGSTSEVLKDTSALQAGDRVTIHTGGGGGYGPPQERALDRLMADVRRGYVSRESAARDYGVVLDEQLQPVGGSTGR
jgi:N-methylhydantoinase B